jgi:hypothetical protein
MKSASLFSAEYPTVFKTDKILLTHHPVPPGLHTAAALAPAEAEAQEPMAADVTAEGVEADSTEEPFEEATAS